MITRDKSNFDWIFRIKIEETEKHQYQRIF